MNMQAARNGAALAVALSAVMALAIPVQASSQARPQERGGLVIPLPPGTPPSDPAYRGNPALSWYYMVKDGDADGDGLSDYEELHKYLTDPLKADSDGDGVADGDANERREFTYTIEAIRRLRTWFQPEAMNDTFQDIEVISEKDGTLTYRVILYPYANEVLAGDPGWKAHAGDPAFARLLAPSRTANWDEAMRAEILASLPAGIATDLDLARYLVPALFARRTNPAAIAKGVDPMDLRVDLRGADAFIPPASKPLFKAKASRAYPADSDTDFLLGMLFARTMFDRRLDGACTESATYMVAVLRAAGIPARGIETNALLDLGDPAQRALLGHLTNADIREALEKEAPSYNGHHYLEAFIGGRWVKINNDGRIGVSILDIGGTAISCKCDAYFDVSDTPVSDIWRQGFPKPLPYSLVSLSDRYGPYFDKARLTPAPVPAPWGVSVQGKTKAYLIGGKAFCEGNTWRLPGLKPTLCAAQFFKPEWLDENAVIVISSETAYGLLPEALKKLVTREEHRLVTYDRPFVVRLASSVVIFVSVAGP